MEVPPVRYARTPEGDHVAYQAFGDGDAWVMLLAEWAGSIDASWEHPAHVRNQRLFASMNRFVMLDHRGTGCSDPLPLDLLGDLEVWATDLEAVMDALGKPSLASIFNAGGPVRSCRHFRTVATGTRRYSASSTGLSR